MNFPDQSIHEETNKIEKFIQKIIQSIFYQYSPRSHGKSFDCSAYITKSYFEVGPPLPSTRGLLSVIKYRYPIIMASKFLYAGALINAAHLLVPSFLAQKKILYIKKSRKLTLRVSPYALSEF